MRKRSIEEGRRAADREKIRKKGSKTYLGAVDLLLVLLPKLVDLHRDLLPLCASLGNLIS